MDWCRRGEDAAPTRVMVFAPTSEAAQACASPIRNVLWGAHKVAVLLPEGEEPIKVPERPFQPSLLCLSAFPFMLDQPSPWCLLAFSFVPFDLLCAFQPSPLCYSVFPLVPFGLLLCAFRPPVCLPGFPFVPFQPPVCLSAFPSAPVTLLLVPLSILLCIFQPVPCICSAFPFTGLAGAQTGGEQDIHS